MGTVSTFEEIIVTLVFIVPGFLAIFFASKLINFQKPISIFEHTIWSLIASIIIYIAFIIRNGIANYDQLSVIVFQPYSIITVFVFAMIEGFGFAILQRLDLLKYIRKVVYFKSKIQFSPDPYVWDDEFARKAPSWALVYTTNGLEYKGVPSSWTIGATPKELLLAKPKMIIRNKQWIVVDEIELGDSILFVKEDIARIVHF